MAQSYIDFTGDGSTTDFTIPFPYLAKSHIVVLVNSVATSSYTWLSATQIRFTAAPAVAAAIRLKRVTPSDARLVNFQNGTALDASADLNQDGNQLLYLIQEEIDALADATVPSLSVDTTKLALNAVTNAKLAKMATRTLKGNTGGSTADPSDVSPDDVKVIADGTTTARDLSARFAEVLNVRDFNAKGDGTTDDTAAIQAALTAMTAGTTVLFPNGTYKVNGALTLSGVSNLTVIFQGCTFNIGDTGTGGTITNTSIGKIGFLFKNCSHLHVLGQARLIGQGTVGTTSLAGMVFDTCAYAEVPAEFYYENMAAGRFVFWCDEGRFGNITAKSMNGLQTFEAPPTNPAGSAEVIVGCRYSHFGEIVGYDILKSVRYLSLALTGGSAAIDNQYCKLGPISAAALAGSAYAQLTQARSALNCTFAPMVGTGFTQGVAIQQYSGDEAWSAQDGNVFQHIGGTFLSTSSSSDCVLTQETTSSNAMGSNKVLSITANCAGEFGVTCIAGRLAVDNLEISGGCDYPVFSYGCTLKIGRLIITGQHKECVLFGLACHLAIDFADFGSGSKNGASGVIQFSNSYGSGSFGTVLIGRIRYNNNASGTNYNYLYVDLTNGFEKVTVGHVEAITAPVSAHLRCGSDEFFVRRGLYSATGIPTTQAYSRGTVLWNSAPSAAGTPGWLCTTAGTPGTWKAMANLAA